MNKSLQSLWRLSAPGLVVAVAALTLSAPMLTPAAVAAEDVAAIPPQTISKELRCPVCGMFPARYPKWMAQVIFKDKTLRAFDSPADLFRFVHNLAKYERNSVRSREGVTVIYLTDYAKGGWVDARQAYFVAGSSARGPMNNADLPAFNGQEAAEKFAAGKGGRVLGFEQITAELVANLEKEGATHDSHDDHAAHGH